jgi:hypothetical protein
MAGSEVQGKPYLVPSAPKAVTICENSKPVNKTYGLWKLGTEQQRL